MKKIIPILLCIVLLGGCLSQGEKRPEYNNDEVWICEKPYMEMYWHLDPEDQTDIAPYGKITLENKTTDFVFSPHTGPRIFFYAPEAAQQGGHSDKVAQYLLFEGRADYDTDNYTIQINEKGKDFFGGEMPTLKFKKYKIENMTK